MSRLFVFFLTCLFIYICLIRFKLYFLTLSKKRTKKQFRKKRKFFLKKQRIFSLLFYRKKSPRSFLLLLSIWQTLLTVIIVIKRNTARKTKAFSLHFTVFSLLKSSLDYTFVIVIFFGRAHAHTVDQIGFGFNISLIFLLPQNEEKNFNNKFT